MDYFQEIFKPGFLAGSFGILLLLIVGYFFETEVNQTSNFDVFWLAPVVLTGIGLSKGTIQGYRKNQKQVKDFKNRESI